MIAAQTLIGKRNGIRQLQTAMRKSTREYERTHAKLSHIRALQKHSDFFRRTSSREICLACLVAQSSVHLPCKCTLCEYCFRSYGKRATGLTVLIFTDCPLCCEKYHPSFRLRLAPPTAGYRTLALDGGGVRGIIQLDIISHIEDKIGLPIQLFVDLVVGTSVGKLFSIIALLSITN